MADSIAFYKSPTTLAAIGAIAGGLVGLSHFACLVFGFCVLEAVSMELWTIALGAILAIAGGVYALYRRIKAGNDPEDPAAKLSLH